ncbi:MAG: trimeric intracellular cation channel family protein [Gammaproteobacteria bacterium]
MSGAQLAESGGHRAIVVILMGTITGVGGGVLRDVLTAKIPLILRQDSYATAAIAGIVMYLVLRALGMMRPWAFGIGMSFIVALRLSTIYWKLQLPVF